MVLQNVWTNARKQLEAMEGEVSAGDGVEETVVVDDGDDNSVSRKSTTRHLPNQTSTTTPSNMEEETMDGGAGGSGGTEAPDGMRSTSMTVEDTMEDDEGKYTRKIS